MGHPPRYISGAPESFGPNGHRRCRMCGEEVKPPKMTFCSERCVEMWCLRSSAGGARAFCLQRDNGICLQCGLDTLALRNALWERLKKAIGKDAINGREWPKVAAMAAAHLAQHGYRAPNGLADLQADGFFWQADHIIPVADGGGLAGLENLQTLCSPCHRRKTRLQVRRKSEARDEDGRRPGSSGAAPQG